MNIKDLQNKYDELVREMRKNAIEIIERNNGEVSYEEQTEDVDEIIITVESGEYAENIKLCKVSVNNGTIFMYSEDGDRFEAINGEHYYYVLELLRRTERNNEKNEIKTLVRELQSNLTWLCSEIHAGNFQRREAAMQKVLDVAEKLEAEIYRQEREKK